MHKYEKNTRRLPDSTSEIQAPGLVHVGTEYDKVRHVCERALLTF